ncbi:GNAT family N-acetyltransferase [Streptomyces sp. NPDC057403]|uniref:GNAT family N-acetyltransferase n=1 Tax=Streptomyces sp. NPDC057403 TaxID=3346119 RepID=UPI0036A28AE9
MVRTHPPRTSDSTRLSLREVDGRTDQREYREAIQESFSPEYGEAVQRVWSRPSAVDRQYVLAREGHQTVGAFSVHSLGPWTAIHDVCIHEAYRGRGFGSELIQAVSAGMDRVHCPYLQCEDGWMPDFYRSVGFETVHRRTGFTVSRNK